MEELCKATSTRLRRFSPHNFYLVLTGTVDKFKDDIPHKNREELMFYVASLAMEHFHERLEERIEAGDKRAILIRCLMDYKFCDSLSDVQRQNLIEIFPNLGDWN